MHGDVSAVRAAIRDGGDPCSADRDGFTPLHFAAQEGHGAVARALLEHGADLEARNKYGGTPLWVALMNVRDGEGDVVRVLLQAGASPDAKNATGISPRDLVSRVANYDLGRFFNGT